MGSNTSSASSRALYRKYRSQHLEDVVGQEHVTETLSSAIKAGSISHAYLFTGPRGVGKTSVARLLAFAINGLSYTPDAQHLDIIEIDAASNRGIDEVRDLRDKVHIAPTTGKYKVYIIDEVHMMTTPAFNALLKTLEEPPAHAVFILATTEVHKLPATIISRTQRHTFLPLSETAITDHLEAIAKKENITIDPSALRLIAEHADGGMRDALSMLDQVHTNSDAIDDQLVQRVLGIAEEKRITNLLKAIEKGDDAAVIKQVDATYQAGIQATQLADQLITVVKQQKQMNIDFLEHLLEVAPAYSPKLQLEVTLLREATRAMRPTRTNTEQPRVDKNTDSRDDSDNPTPVEIESDNSTDEPDLDKSSLDSFSTKQWSQILQEIKRTNNSLYGVLRLAEPHEDGSGTLILRFGFPFHMKRVDETKNKQIVANVTESITGKTYAVKAVVDETLRTVQPKPTTTQPAGTLSAVMSVMGGGDIVEYADD
jgi:DNA polymerase-3 subunit gamma/tau